MPSSSPLTGSLALRTPQLHHPQSRTRGCVLNQAGVTVSSPLGSTSSLAPGRSTPGVRTPHPVPQAPPPASKPVEGSARSRAGTGPVQQSSSGPTRPRPPHYHQQRGRALKRGAGPAKRPSSSNVPEQVSPKGHRVSTRPQ
ncbi:hypothetical protein NDU88_001826 [Pleurodeles waltl]|uniref:Uncharacterized protein n=1 Tax=Pleurodeles waltl TaxID=8319 RepID=A0AAV7UX68_PLEWA|nr:hypothetical protein NDU88_001826 [Pleurodeles waltl]